MYQIAAVVRNMFQLLVQTRNRGIFYSYTLPIERKNKGALLKTASKTSIRHQGQYNRAGLIALFEC